MAEGAESGVVVEAGGAQSEAEPAGPGLDEARSWVGSRLDGMGAMSLGKVEGAYVDAETGRPEWLVVRLGRFGHHGLVPAREAVGGVERVWVPYGREAIRSTPKVDGKSPITCEWERSLLAYFGIDGELGRAAELADRDPDSVTAHPAN
jgi:hypothetical protein